MDWKQTTTLISAALCLAVSIVMLVGDTMGKTLARGQFATAILMLVFGAGALLRLILERRRGRLTNPRI
jgi:hypothetical protein